MTRSKRPGVKVLFIAYEESLSLVEGSGAFLPLSASAERIAVSVEKMLAVNDHLFEESTDSR